MLDLYLLPFARLKNNFFNLLSTFVIFVFLVSQRSDNEISVSGSNNSFSGFSIITIILNIILILAFMLALVSPSIREYLSSNNYKKLRSRFYSKFRCCFTMLSYCEKKAKKKGTGVQEKKVVMLSREESQEKEFDLLTESEDRLFYNIQAANVENGDEDSQRQIGYLTSQLTNLRKRLMDEVEEKQKRNSQIENLKKEIESLKKL